LSSAVNEQNVQESYAFVSQPDLIFCNNPKEKSNLVFVEGVMLTRVMLTFFKVIVLLI